MIGAKHGKPRYTTQQLQSALCLSIAGLRTLRNDFDRKNRIKATSGRSTRDQRWSTLDAIRLAILQAVPFRGGMTARDRQHLFKSLPDTKLRAAVHGENWWMTLEEFTGIRFFRTLSDLERQSRFEGNFNAVLIDVKAVAQDVANLLEQARIFDSHRGRDG